jgi:hypothetical protein
MSIFMAHTIIFILQIIQLVICIFIVLDFYGSMRLRVPYLSIRNHVLPHIHKEFNLHSGSVVYDLGAGHGRVLSYLKKITPGITAIGIELAPLPWFLGSMFQYFYPKNQRISLICRDIRKINLAQATHVFMYLSQKLTNELAEKCVKELNPGTIVITCDFFIENKEPIKVIDCSIPTERLGKKLYMYHY